MSGVNIKDILLAEQLDPARAAALLTPYGFKNPVRADANLQALAREPSERQLVAEILEEMLVCIARSADPDQSLTYLERFAHAALNRTHLFSYLRDSPRTLEILAKALGGSPYMAEILIRDPHHFYWVTDPQILYAGRKRRELRREMVRALKVIPDEQRQLDYLRALKRREMLWIGIRDLLKLCTVQETLSSLSLLAEVLIAAAHWICAASLRRQLAIPAGRLTQFTVIAMGKLGGGELNFSSDVDLVYVYEDSADNAGGRTASEYFRRLAQKITAGLKEFTGEGYVYRVDLRLRPEGEGSHIAESLESYDRYYRTRMSTWERLALLKAWPVAGDRALGRQFLTRARGWIHDRPFDAQALEDVRSMKRKIDKQMAAREQRTRNVKLGTGGIREIELIVQSLQVWRGGQIPAIHSRRTLDALAALCDADLMPDEECEALTDGYIFLRDVENKLQMVNDAQTHSLPRAPEELTACARLLGYTDSGQGSAAERFLGDYQQHTGRVNRIFERYLGTGSLAFT